MKRIIKSVVILTIITIIGTVNFKSANAEYEKKDNPPKKWDCYETRSVSLNRYDNKGFTIPIVCESDTKYCYFLHSSVSTELAYCENK